MNHTSKEKFPVDIVYLWCDGNDPVFLEKKEKALASQGKKLEKQAIAPGRFVDNSELKYALRSLEKYAPFIRYVYIVTDNQTPHWLNTNHPQLKMINHQDIIPQEYLPTFNSNVIESFIHKIPGLSEHFLYGNDDMFFSAPSSPDFFFDENSNPIIRGLKRKYPENINDLFEATKINHHRIYHQTLTYSNWLVATKFGKTHFFAPHHNIDAYRKSYMEDTISIFKDAFEKTYTCKFREVNTVQRIIFSYTDVAKNRATLKVTTRFKRNILRFMPLFITLRFMRWDSLTYQIDQISVRNWTPELKQKIKKCHFKLFCVNDSENATDNDREQLKNDLQEIFPTPSLFEKKTIV